MPRSQFYRRNRNRAPVRGAVVSVAKSELVAKFADKMVAAQLAAQQNFANIQAAAEAELLANIAANSLPRKRGRPRDHLRNVAREMTTDHHCLLPRPTSERSVTNMRRYLDVHRAFMHYDADGKELPEGVDGTENPALIWLEAGRRSTLLYALGRLPLNWIVSHAAYFYGERGQWTREGMIEQCKRWRKEYDEQLAAEDDAADGSQS